MVLLGHLPGRNGGFKHKITTIFGAPRLKMSPHRRFGGSSVAEIFIFLSSNKNCPLFVKKICSYLGSTKSYRPPQFFAESVSSFFFWHQFGFSKVNSALESSDPGASNGIRSALKSTDPGAFNGGSNWNPTTWRWSREFCSRENAKHECFWKSVSNYYFGRKKTLDKWHFKRLWSGSSCPKFRKWLPYGRRCVVRQ